MKTIANPPRNLSPSDRYPTLPIRAEAGCSCKLPGNRLVQAISRCVGSYKPEDAAELSVSGCRLYTTVDGGPPVHGNPYIAAYISVVHACSDLFAVGSIPLYISSFLQLGEDVDDLALDGFLAGAWEASRDLGARIVTGHTIKGDQTVLAYSVIGEPWTARTLQKIGAQVGDSILISKPVGTGLLIRARVMEVISDAEDETLTGWMSQSNLHAMQAAIRAQVSAATDVTGFGLVGHLAEMLGGLGATIDLAQMPRLPGAARLAGEVGGSAWTVTNMAYARATHLVDVDAEHEVLVSDPQTSGGLLVTCPSGSEASLLAAGYSLIGTVNRGQSIMFN